METPETTKIKLKKPLLLADGNTIDEITLIEPNAAVMKGLNRYEILTLSDDAHKKLLPRISQPVITAPMFEQMSLKDTQKIMNAVTGFFVDAEESAT